MKKKRAQPALQLEEDVLQELQEGPAEAERDPAFMLSASGTSFRLKGIAGMYEVSRSGTVLENPRPEVPGGLVQLRCHYNDLDVEHSRLLGAGASGKVLAVRHKPSGMWLALKKISIADPQQMQQIQRELDTLYLDGEDHIISFYGAFFDRGNVMIALELMDGCLGDAIVHMTSIPETVLRGVARQVLLGLQYLHKQRHVVHRDIKPSNILFSRDGSIKISDFGISAALQDTLMQANTFIGTLLFMSPERLEGGNYSYPADIWSLGLTLINLATGRHPFATLNDKASFWDVLRFIEEEEPPTLPTDRIYSQSFRAFVGLCMRRSPAERASARQLLEHPFAAEMADEDAQAVCREWFPQVRQKMKAAEAERRAQAQRNIAMAEELLSSL
eukprot:EG_transcript_15016